MSRLTAKMVFCGLVIAWRLAIWPTSRSPSSVKPTIEEVVRLPSRLASTCGVPPSITEARLLVVPRSMPRTLFIAHHRRARPPPPSPLARAGPALGRHRHLHQRRPQQAPVQGVAALQLLDHRRSLD